MALEIKLTQKLSQSLVMTPQLQQAIKLLQLGRMEYVEAIEKELLENPVLEDSRDDEGGGDNSEGASAAPASNNETPGTQVNGDSPSNDDTKQISNEDFDWTEYLDNSFGDSWGYTSSSSASAASEDDRPSIEATVSNPEGLVQHILWQLRTTSLPEEDYEIAMQVVGNFDHNGYLQCSVEELAESLGKAVEDIEEVLEVIQTLDPPGIGARDLRECLLIQLRQRGQQESLVGRIVENHLHKLEIRRYDLIAKEEEVTVEEVYEAIRVIQKLEPRPGRPFVEESPIYITPDIYVRKVGDEYVVSLNEQGMPKLRVSPRYRELLASGSSIEDAPNKEYLQDRLRSAAWLIKSIHQRQQTIFKVTESIMRFQREFLEKGVGELKPLVLRDVANEVGMHESTVSRVTTNKYVHTPQGVFELKYFFSSGLQGGDGTVSSEAVKERIRALISEENPKKPLSDQALVDTLKSEGVSIARRTVAKYREMMGILSSSRRKKVF